jgi:PhnB protein
VKQKHIRHGFGAVRPYVYGRLDTITLIREAFDARELERLSGPNGFHIEAQIGDAMIVLEAAEPPPPGGAPSSIYVYVPDVDTSFTKALEVGALAISKPEQKPYHERAAGVKDTYGNTWWIATYTDGISDDRDAR